MTAGEVVVGVVGKPLGVRGEVYVQPDPDLAHDFPPGTTYELTGGVTLTVAESRLHGNRRVLRFSGADDREAAEALRGAVLTVPRDALEVDDEALWVDDLLGREVHDPAGALVGVVEAVRDGHAHDYVVVARTDGGESLVPLVADLLDIRGEVIVVQPIPGLLDDHGETA